MKLSQVLLLLHLLCPLLTGAPIVEVTTIEDAAEGSLRQALIDVDEDGTINFSSLLDGEIVSLTSGAIQIEKSVTLDASNLEAGITLSGGDSAGVLLLQGEADMVLRNITIADAFFDGGVVMAGSGKVEMHQCSIINNHSEHSGGGIYIGEGNELVLNTCLIEGNSADRGGGIYNFGSMVIEGCTFRNNEGREDGGGLYNRGTETIMNCLFVGNSAREEGGAMWLRRDTTLVGCTIFENEAENGGGIFCSKDLNIVSCTIVQNIAAVNYGEFYAAGSLRIQGTIVSDNQQSGTLTEITDLLLSASSHCYFENGAPLDELGDYGGFTETLRPTFGSTGLIDLGESNLALLTDGRGKPRKYGDATDIGAVEYQGEVDEELFALPNGDPDGDGVETMLEIAMGRDPFVNDHDSVRRLKIDRVGDMALITFGVNPEYAEDIELTLRVTKGIEGLEILLTDEEIRAIPLNDGIVTHELLLDARVKFYRLDARIITEP